MADQPAGANRGKKELPVAQQHTDAAQPVKNADATSDATKTAGKAAQGAEGASKTAKLAEKAGAKAGAAFDGYASRAAGDLARKTVAGNSDNALRKNAGKYAGAAASGAVSGAQKGGLPGAAVGAAKEVGVRAAKDAHQGAVKITGGSPVAQTADERGIGNGAGGVMSGGPEDSGAGKSAALAGTAVAAPPAAGASGLLTMLMLMKQLAFKAAAAAMNLATSALQIVGAMLKAAGNFIAAPFAAVGNVVGSLVGGAFGAGAGIVAAPVAAIGSGVTAAVTAAALVGALFTAAGDPARYDSGLMDSGCVVTASSSSAQPADQQGSQEEEQQAKTIYSVLKKWGMPDENIAGILGNWAQESGIDPTSVQTYPVRTYVMTPEKKAAAQNTVNGIGLGQWTAGRNTLLRDYAKSKNKDWWELTTQLAFMASGDNPGDVDVFKDMIKKSQGTPAAAARHFHDAWERSADTGQMVAERERDAEAWFGKMSGWKVDESAVKQVEDIAGNFIDTVGGIVRIAFGLCDAEAETAAGGVSLKAGGMSLEEAEKMMTLYRKEGLQRLTEWYPGGSGPGDCGNGDKADNCVGFSMYFLHKYTSVPWNPWIGGNGIEVAPNVAKALGKPLLKKPVVYSVASGPGLGPEGHTFVVLGIKGDQAVVGEANCGTNHAGTVAKLVPLSQLSDGSHTFVDVSDLMQGGKGKKPGV